MIPTYVSDVSAQQTDNSKEHDIYIYLYIK